MNTPTPRTDEGEWDITSYDARQPEMVVTSFLARALERELAELTEAQNLQPAIWESLKTAISERNQLRAEVATERARLDWLESDAGMDWQWSDAEGGIVSREKVDAAMKEDVK